MPVFLHPIWLLLPLAVIPAVVASALLRGRRRTRLFGKVPDRLRAALLPDRAAVSALRRWVPRVLVLAGIGGALARPQWGQESIREASEGRDIILAVDVSRSMLAGDAAPSRLERAKLACLDLMRQLPNDRFGVIAFAGSSYPLAPLTADHDAVRETLRDLDESVIPSGGTDLGAPVRQAIEAFTNEGETRRRALVMLSDGEDLTGDTEGLGTKARERGIYLFTFTVGTERGAMIPDPASPGGFLRDPQTRQPVVTKADPTALARLAAAGGGTSAPLVDGTRLLAEIERGLEDLDRFHASHRQTTAAIERYRWPLALALLGIPLCLLAGPRRLRVGRKVAIPTKAAAAVAICLLGMMPPPARAADAALDQAVEAMGDGRLPEAVQLAEQALRGSAGEDPVAAAHTFGAGLYENGRARLAAAEKSEGGQPPAGTAAPPPAGPDLETMRGVLTDWEDALGHLDHASGLRPKDGALASNRDTVEKAVEDLRQRIKEREEQEKQQEQKQDQQQQQQQQQDQQQEGGEGDQQQPQQQGENGEKNQGQKSSDPGDQGGGKPGEEEEKRDGQDGGQREGDQEEGQKKDGEGGEDGDLPEREGKDGTQEGPDGENGEPVGDASTGEGKQIRRTLQLPVDKDGRIVLSEDPSERAEQVEMIRRILRQRSMEQKVPLGDPPKRNARNERNW